MPCGVQVQVLFRAPILCFRSDFRISGNFLLPSAARSKGENGLAVRGSRAHAIQRTLKNKVKDLPGLKELIFINKRGQIVDIMALV